MKAGKTNTSAVPAGKSAQVPWWQNVPGMIAVGMAFAFMNAGVFAWEVVGIFADETASEICFDGVDNDENGYNDCADPECYESPVCAVQEVCSDGADNDLDGRADCMDTDCRGDLSCPMPELCGDGIDNDLNGYVDCVDEACMQSPVCPAPEVCDDGIDNDEDGQADCADSFCERHKACGNVQEPEVRVIREIVEKIREVPVQVQTQTPSTPGYTFTTPGLDADTVQSMIDAEVAKVLAQIPESTPEQIQQTLSRLPIFEEITVRETETIQTIITNTVQEYFYGDSAGLIPVEKICADGLDNDENGDTDCDDTNCRGHVACLTVTATPSTEDSITMGDD